MPDIKPELLKYKTKAGKTKTFMLAASGYSGNSQWNPNVFADIPNNLRAPIYRKAEFSKSPNIDAYAHVAAPNSEDPASHQLLGLSLFERALGELKAKIDTEQGGQPVNFTMILEGHGGDLENDAYYSSNNINRGASYKNFKNFVKVMSQALVANIPTSIDLSARKYKAAQQYLGNFLNQQAEMVYRWIRDMGQLMLRVR